MSKFQISKAWTYGPYFITNGQFELEVTSEELIEYIENKTSSQKSHFEWILNMDNEFIKILYPTNKLRTTVLEYKMKNI